jgi:hypothetical protein
MAGDHHQCLNPTWHRLINVALRSPGRGGDRGFLCSFLDRLLGDGAGKACPPDQTTFGGANRSLGLNHQACC